MTDLGGALALAVVQGLTEFLPVSSDGHLRLAHELVGFQTNNDLGFDLTLHLGTLCAVFIVFGRDIVSLLSGVARGLRRVPEVGLRGALLEEEGLRLALLVGVAMLPTGLIGLGLKMVYDRVEIGLVGVGGFLILNGVILLSSRLAHPRSIAPDPLAWHGLGLRGAFLVGVAQGLAALPGVSRSGSTIVTGLALGIERSRAARFSFVLSIPAILAAFAVEFEPSALGDVAGGASTYLLAASVSALVGILALKVVLRVLEGAKFHWFGWYCIALGALTILVGRSH